MKKTKPLAPIDSLIFIFFKESSKLLGNFAAVTPELALGKALA